MKEYERAVIFRLGRLRSGGAKGPGIFFIVPCIDSYKKLDLRTVSFDVPPQEVRLAGECWLDNFSPDSVPGLCDPVRGCGGLLQGVQCNGVSGKCGECTPLNKVSI